VKYLNSKTKITAVLYALTYILQAFGIVEVDDEVAAYIDRFALALLALFMRLGIDKATPDKPWGVAVSSRGAEELALPRIGPWQPVLHDSPRPFRTVLLYRQGDIYPAVGHSYGGTGEWILEEGGPEDAEFREYPPIGGEAGKWSPSHFAEIHWDEDPKDRRAAEQ
jgi:hypothetical protein